MKLDDTDWEIIRFLKKDGRMANHEIAKKLSVSEGTIRNRIKKLYQEKVLTIQGMVNPGVIITKQIVFIGAKISVSKDPDKAAEAISKIPNVLSVIIVTGRYDLLIELFIEPYNIIHFISNDLGKIGSIASTESIMTLKSYNKWI
jgi:Lrp/AsnC family transcriptional regulator for asnA, asnC and gidA